MPSNSPPREPNTPVTAHRASSAEKKKANNAATTPKQKSQSSPPTAPKSAPTASSGRQRANTRKTEPPTLLTDFLLGRPSPARRAAQRRKSEAAAVNAEVREEMRQSSVRKLQAPGGVRERVKAWQKASAAEMATADPLAAPSEPTEIAFFDDEESVTERDRMRIKFRHPKKTKPKPPANRSSPAGEEDDHVADQLPTPKDRSPPKKRVVSDDHWVVKKKKKSPPRQKNPPQEVPTGLPKDFLQRPACKPPVSKMVSEWVTKIEPGVPESDVIKAKPRKPSGGADRHQSVESAESPSPQSSIPHKTKPPRTKAGHDDAGGAATPTRKWGAANDGIRVTPSKEGKRDGDEPRTPRRTKPIDDDGIRVTPMQSTCTSVTDEGSARQMPGRRIDADDGIRVTPKHSSGRKATGDRKDPGTSTSVAIGSASRGPSREPRTDPKRSLVHNSPYDMIGSQVGSAADSSERRERSEWIPDTPTRLSRTQRADPRPRAVRISQARAVSNPRPVTVESVSDSHESQSALESDISATIPGKPLSDIPFGRSAFSELDLPLGADAHHIAYRPKPKAQRSPSFKAVPKVFKKVVSGGKKIIQETVDPPKPVENKPPSIETWLKNTVDPVDPFVESPAADPTPAQTRKSVEKEWIEDLHVRRRSDAVKPRHDLNPGPSAAHDEGDEVTVPQSPIIREAVAETTPNKSPASATLKRKGATRSGSSPLKLGGKRNFREALKDAFRGQSNGMVFLPKTYTSQEERVEERFYDDEYDLETPGKMSELLSGAPTSASSWSSEDDDPETPMAGPRRRPPTTGNHALSTIISEESSSSYLSDTTSAVSDTTVTQTTLTKESEVSQTKSERPGSGLKRRLTKHSDLVSVLSLPRDADVPGTRPRPSIRRALSTRGVAALDEFFKEFLDDDAMYQRELKTLVDGVVPVLLNQAIHASSPTKLLGSNSPGRKSAALSESVVSMGVALEKLKNAHRRVPRTDVDRLLSWLQATVPLYDNYLEVWRLGFQDLVVNLAPASGLDDNDSLLDALPRNEDGDVINELGERVDVAHFLKRPLLRVKMLVKLIKGIHGVSPSSQAESLAKDIDALQAKARRRYKEETARMVDEDALNTDTSRVRDLRTLAAMESVKIDPSRQVSAKDIFALSIKHSNGQRLECSVEMVHRDNPRIPSDKGDILIRETGNGRRTWLLFPPIPVALASTRHGETSRELVVMVRGTHNSRSWHELLTLSTQDEEQISDWISILGTSPIPPYEPEPSVVGSPNSDDGRRKKDIPVGERWLASTPPGSPKGTRSPGATTPTTPTSRSRYHARDGGLPYTPPEPAASASPPSSGQKTPTQKHFSHQENGDRGRPLSESMRPDPSSFKNTSPHVSPHSTRHREDGAPPPPVHRTLSPKSPPSLQPPTELDSQRTKRRTSSPLKHEYLPSDVSSVSSQSEGSDRGYPSEESDTESSDDEIDSVDLPETEIGVSIKEPRPAPAESILTTDSLTPSHSASQAGNFGPAAGNSQEHPEATGRFVASLSQWSDKRGVWKDLSSDLCSILVSPGMIEAFPLLSALPPEKRASTNANNGIVDTSPKPLVALDLTPLVLLRQSTVVDLEIRSALLDHSSLVSLGGGNFRFRCPTSAECFNLYMAVHHARLNNERYIKLENETRFRNFGERKAPDNEGSTSSRRRSWFGRKNSYRASARAPSHSQDAASSAASSNISATSFLRRLTGTNASFNIARSSVDRQTSGANSLYSGSSSSGWLRSPSASIYEGGVSRTNTFGGENIRIRLHLLVSATKWEDFGNCTLQISRPPPGWRQELRANHGLEKRVTVTTQPKKATETPRVALDAVLGSGCFTPMGTRGIVCGVWEAVRDENGEVGNVPATGATGGNIKKWCFQCATANEASWVLRLVHQEVMTA